MKKILFFSVFFILFFLGSCGDRDISNKNIKDNKQGIIVDQLEVDIDKNGVQDSAILTYVGKNDMRLMINNKTYQIYNFWYSDFDFDKKPTLKILDTYSNKLILLYASYKTNGGTDGYFDAYVFEYKNNNIQCIWNRDMLLNTSISYKKLNNNLMLEIQALNFTGQVLLTDNKRLNDIFHEDSREFGDNKFVIRSIENFQFYDYDNDGMPEIFLQAPIYYDTANIYVNSLFSVLSFDDFNKHYEKTFLLDRKSIKAQIVKKILKQGMLKENDWGDTLNFWIETNYNKCTEASVKACIQQLIDEGIIYKQDNFYKLVIK